MSDIFTETGLVTSVVDPALISCRGRYNDSVTRAYLQSTLKQDIEKYYMPDFFNVEVVCDLSNNRNLSKKGGLSVNVEIKSTDGEDVMSLARTIEPTDKTVCGYITY